jgi:hypothetical protein
MKAITDQISAYLVNLQCGLGGIGVLRKLEQHCEEFMGPDTSHGILFR